jgi:hypothetical protein
VRHSPLLVATLACLLIGVALMLVFESTLARVIGMPALIAFIVCGLFLIANPGDLGGATEDEH